MIGYRSESVDSPMQPLSKRSGVDSPKVICPKCNKPYHWLKYDICSDCKNEGSSKDVITGKPYDKDCPLCEKDVCENCGKLHEKHYVGGKCYLYDSDGKPYHHTFKPKEVGDDGNL